ncbi:FAD-dependent oxidoreductase [Haloarchaeobius iranensis]|uniref:Dehydrogenase (Flavoprotein) n=1 Tax=Haloarchaeobius iranensis TaxID=996166 RepID=A0A1G9ZAA1_9EURY|nr:FAD-dependent monooxygenase [Haloarchaeobius iranensis]SDN18418.1 Dehydrogenase (flavoprotein) [Haloarchaeobius iranensis]
MTLATVPRYDESSVGTVGERAVVLGGSVAGLCAARVLRDAFESVVVLDRDPLPADPVARDGAPQTRHPHVLLEGGRATLEDLFPGFSETLLEAGGLLVDASRQLREFNGGDYIADAPGRLPTYCASRPLLEAVLRQRTRGLECVDLRGEHRFTGYETDATGQTVTGVTGRDGEGEPFTLAADLVVDATGRTSRTPSWLAETGFQRPATDEVTIEVAYSTIRVERPPDDRRLFLVAPTAPRTRGGALIPAEDGQWEVILQGVHGDDPPTDPEPLQRFADSLPADEFGATLAAHEWRTAQAERYPYPASRRHRYEALDRFPAGLVVTGDALASFNPIYGQGMSVAALEALGLHHALADGGLDELGPRFFDRAAAIVDGVWRVVVGSDFAFAETSGPEPTGAGVTNWYMDRFVRRAHDDPFLSEVYARVTRLEASPTALFRPKVLWRVFRPFGGGSEDDRPETPGSEGDRAV